MAFQSSGSPGHPDAQARSDALYRSLVDDAFGFTAALGADFTVVFASCSITKHLGVKPEQMVGQSAAEFIHPDDLERALLMLSGWSGWGAPAGAAAFRLRHADGQWVPFDVTASNVSDGLESYMGVYCVPVDYQQATDEVLSRLLRGDDRGAALRPVLDVFSWQLNDAHVAITWFEPGVGHRFVSTGLPAELAGAGEQLPEPWATARAAFEPVLQAEGEVADPQVRHDAVSNGRGGVWVVPVLDAGSDVPALVTVWSRADGPRPDGHAYGMSIAATYIELILRWCSQVSALNQAALHDQLTGLPNRKALFDRLEAGDTRGALLFCDLDHFKPVNDAHGHAAGDEVLRRIAHRIQHAVRAGDLVARTGGDEFVVLAPGASLEQAAALAQRIRSAVAVPTSVDGVPLHVGVTIGVAHAYDVVSEATLAGADNALMLAKANARGTVRWAPGDMPADQLPSSRITTE